MRVNIENCALNGSSSTKGWLLDELVNNLKELRDRTNAGDIAALGEFFALFRFNDSDSLDIQKDEENAKRIAACLKACSGISTENLEQNKPLKEGLHGLNERIRDAERQRDELLVALEGLIDMDVAYNCGPVVEDAVDAAKKLIATVKGGL